ncbi:MAG: CRISPR-associated helicase Cas3' [Firmicutes bacterium]|nr:CRISPR-associated helicase Cas3' [Bacillota bacterium]
MCTEKLSQKARSLWAKKSKDGCLSWVPLTTHIMDSAAVAQKMWNHWLSEGAKQAVAAGIEENAVSRIRGGDSECAEQLLVFLSAVHDLGKATPVFQAKKTVCSELDRWMLERIQESGLPMKPASYFARASKTPHALATQILLERAGCNKSIAVILGAHHGKPPSNAVINSCGISTYAENFHLGREGKAAWVAVQQELLDFALKLSGFSTIKKIPKTNMAAQVLLSGLVIMVDWIASGEAYFPYMSLDDVRAPDMKSRVKSAWNSLGLPFLWEADNLWMSSNLYRERFDPPLNANAVQSIAAQAAAAIQSPGIFVLEAPMGAGKTEAALVAAEIFAAKAKRKGVFFALPTQATSDGIFPRILKWVKKLDSDEVHSMRLMHGKAQFNEAYQNLQGGVNIGEDEDGGVMVHAWFEGRKRALLDDFVVGTIDQLLLAALKQKHVMLRHLGLANKVVIIDECHAYDAYMSQYLNMALSWLGAYRVPVIVLSATLPAKKRQEVIDAYLNINSELKSQTDPLGRRGRTQEQPPKLERIASCEYPLITFTDGNKVGQRVVPSDGIARDVQLDLLPEDVLSERLEHLLSNGGCAGIIVNTVKRAQELARTLCERFGEDTVRLLHSRFLAPDRAAKEKKLLEDLGKPGADRHRPEKCIVVGTQVLEQSLDIDFDVLVTDICPMDLLLQRIGRLHRHERDRPEKLRTAFCLVTGLDGDGFEAGTEGIYGKYLLMRTKACLPLPQRLVLPQNISKLVQDVYNDDSHPLPESPEYQKAASEHEKHVKDKEKRARDFRIGRPWQEGDLSGWLNTDVSDKGGEAAVRDGDESIEVLLIQKKRDCRLHFLPWIENGRELAQNEIPAGELARALACCSVRLPPILCASWTIENTIKTLEDLNREQLSEWQKSPWLTGELFLILDENFSASLGEYRLVYDQHFGLLHEREDKSDA